MTGMGDDRGHTAASTSSQGGWVGEGIRGDETRQEGGGGRRGDDACDTKHLLMTIVAIQ